MNAFIFDSAQIRTPLTVEENIQRGREAMKRVISRHVDEPRAMYRDKLGWVSFPWGRPGTQPPSFNTQEAMRDWWQSLPDRFGLFAGGYGVSHIVAKRDWEGEWIKEFQGQKGEELALKLIEVIARGRVVKQGTNATITFPGGHVAILRLDRVKRDEEKDYWLVTGFKAHEQGYKFISESVDATGDDEPSCSTHPEPMRSRFGMGASLDDENKGQQGHSTGATHSMPTGIRHEVGAADSLEPNIAHPASPRNMVTERNTDGNAIFEYTKEGSTMSATADVVCRRVKRAQSFHEIRKVFELFLLPPDADPEMDSAVAKLENYGPGGEKVLAAGTPMAVVFGEGEDVGRYELREALDLIPSHDVTFGFKKLEEYPEGVQERPYHSDAGEQEKVRRNALRLDPRFLVTDNPDAINGPPITTTKGIVLGGNSRTMSIVQAYTELPESARRYREALRERAHVFGFSPSLVEQFKAPVLVRVVADNMDTKDMAKRARLYNQSLTQGLQTKAEGVSKARLVSVESMGILSDALNDFDSIREYLDSPKSQELVDALKADGVIEQTQLSRLTKKGTLLLNEEGKRLVEHVLRGVAVDDYDLLDQLSPAIAAKLDRILSYLAKIKARGEAWDITGKLKTALRQHVKFTNSSTETLEVFWRERSLLPEENTVKEDPQVGALLFFMAKAKPKEVEAAWKMYATAAAHSGKGQMALPGIQPPTPDSTFRKAFPGVFESALEPDWSEFATYPFQDALCLVSGFSHRQDAVFEVCFGLEDTADKAVFDSAQIRTPLTVEENIQRGREAMKRVISRHVDEPRAMYRDKLGWVSFPWGRPGTQPPSFNTQEAMRDWWQSLPDRFGLFAGGYGVSHIVAKRDWEGEWIKEFQGQKGEELALKLIEVIARGRVERRGELANIHFPEYRVILKIDKTKPAKDDKEYWLITGFKAILSGYAFVLESADEIVGNEPCCPTHTDPTRRPESVRLPHNEGEQMTPSILSDPTHSMPTGIRHGVGAADSLEPNIAHRQTDGNRKEMGDFMNTAIFEYAMDSIEKDIRGAESFDQIESLFNKIFALDAGGEGQRNGLEAYKDESSDYGLKVRGIKTREKLNARCREILARVKKTSELTPEDRAVLAQYSGRGGLSDNSQYEYYTPKPVAEGVWDALTANGFANGNVLDPCCGAGIFSGTKPDGVVVTANDLDPVGSGVAALLNPEDTVSTQPFERVATNTPDDTFDSCVGNVPFGDARGASKHEDPAYKNEKLIERYFLHRIIDKVKPGGLACLVVPVNIVGAKGKRWEEFRIAISKKAEFLGAHKLPSKTFAAQGTDTVVDIIVLRKHSRELSTTVGELAIDKLREARVVWNEFVEGKYWQGEGRQFIMGRFVPKKAGDRWSRDTVDGDIDDASLKRKLAQKFHSRIDWESLTLAEPVTRAYNEGDRKSISGTMYEFVAGQWQKVAEPLSGLKIEEGKFGAKTLDELRSILSSPQGALSLRLENLLAVYREFPHLLTSLQNEAVQFAMSQASNAFHEQIYRGCIIGGMMARMASKAESGEDVTTDRAELQEMVTAEVEKYGHPKNNKGLVLAGAGSRLFGMFKNALDEKGNFSDLLTGTLDKSKRETPYDTTSPADIVSHLFIREGQQNIFLEDVQALYNGAAPITSLGDLAEREELAITPDGRIMPLNRYCAGDIYPKIAECAQAIAETDDIRLKAKFRSQAEAMRSRQIITKSEDIVFGMRQKWLSRKYVVQFLRENGYPKIEFGTKREIDVEQYDGSVEKEVRFAADYENPDGEFSGVPDDGGWYKQFEKYLNGGKVTSSKEENKQKYLDQVSSLERQFNVWMQQHPDIIELTDQFNRQFNGHVPFEYEGDSLGIDEYISGEIVPHSYQNAEVRRLSEQGSGICGFGVGLGKSFTALAAAAYNHKKGRAKRTCVVVPSAVLENWYHEARQFYAEGHMRSNVLFVGLQPKKDKDGIVQRKPVLDEKGNPKAGRNGETIMQDVVEFVRGKEGIHEAMWKIPQSNFSLVVMTKEKFEAIPLRPATMRKYTDEMVSRSLMSEKLAEKIAAGKKSYQDDKTIANIEAKFSDEGSKKAEEYPYLEDMGFDSIMTDESHFFKNSFEAGKDSQGIAYLPTAPAAKIAIDMAIKSHYIRGQNNGRGVYGLTATPVTNSPFEIFNMLSLVCPIEEFERFGVHTVDDFVRVFGKIETVDKVSVSGEIKTVDGLVGFQNLDGLRNLFHKYVTVKNVKDVDDEIHVPAAEEFEENVAISDEQAELYEELRQRAKTAAMPVAEGEKRESIFSIIRDMDRLTTDIDMYNRTMTFTFQKKHREAVDALLDKLPQQMTLNNADEETGEKISIKRDVTRAIVDAGDTFTLTVPDFAEESVLMLFPELGIIESEMAHPVTPKYAKLMENLGKHFEAGGKQIIFTEEKTQHQKLRRIIVHHLPVTTEQIGIINADDASGDKLDKVSKAYNAGQYKFIIANKKAEVGVNLQKGTTAIHHLTLPWTPASINQRNGRGVRQGNTVDSVALYYYCGKGTFDSYRKDLLKAKANWINDLLLGEATSMENGDVTGMDELLDMLADNPEEAKRMRAERLAAAKNKKDEAFKASLRNKLQVLASIQNSLDTLDAKKEERRGTLQGQIGTAEKSITRIKGNLAGGAQLSEAERVKAVDNLASAERRLVSLKADLEGLDAKFAEQRTKLEANRKMTQGTLRQADTEGRLPFDAKLIDTPASALVTGNGDVLSVGDMIEINKTGDIWKIESVSQEDRTFVLAPMTNVNDNSRKTGTTNNLPAYTKVSYAESELALKKVLGARWLYAELRTSGIDRDTFLAHANEIRLDPYGGAVYRQGEMLTVSFLHSVIPEGATLAWPEPENEDWRKAVCKQYLEATRTGEYVHDAIIHTLFGDDFRTIAESYGTTGTDAEILAMLAEAWEAYKLTLSTDVVNEGAVGELRVLRMLASGGGGAVKEPPFSKFDNKKDVVRLTKDFLNGLIETAQKRAQEEAATAAREAEEVLKSDPRYKSVPADLAAKFSELGLIVRANTKEAYIPGFKGRRGVTYEPFSRWFLQDKNGKMGRLFRTKDTLKAIHGAQFTSEWTEYSGAWWHVSSSVSLEELYELLS